MKPQDRTDYIVRALMEAASMHKEDARALLAEHAADVQPKRPSDDHAAVYLDDEGGLWAEYPTVPPSDSILPLVWASEVCSSKHELEDRGYEFRVIGWSK